MLPNDIDIYLEDRQNNIFTLLNDTDYILTAASDLQGIGRFYLRFSQGTLSIDETGLDTLQVLSLDNPKRIVVKGQILESTEFILYDIRGREVLKRDLVEGTTINTIDTSQFTKGVYLVKLKNTSNIISKKLIIR